MNDMENLWITAQIGTAIRQARESRGLSQAELADRLNASQPQIAKYEKGELAMPLSRFFDLATVLEVTAADLFGSDTP